MNEFEKSQSLKILACYGIDIEKSDHKNHKYIKKENGKYIYDDSNKSIKDIYEFDDVKSVKDLSNNIDYILSNFGNSKAALSQAFSYLLENQKFAKDFLKENDMNSKEDFDNYILNRRVKMRVGKNKEKEKNLQNFNEEKINMNVDNIVKIAYESENEMQEKIKNTYKI